jgi:hypothetical protein
LCDIAGSTVSLCGPEEKKVIFAVFRSRFLFPQIYPESHMGAVSRRLPYNRDRTRGPKLLLRTDPLPLAHGIAQKIPDEFGPGVYVFWLTQNLLKAGMKLSELLFKRLSGGRFKNKMIFCLPAAFRPECGYFNRA